jgi:S-adenosyl methyltransferase
MPPHLEGPNDPPASSPGIDTSVPHSARVWDYWLGGKDNYAADRAAGDQFAETFPDIVDIARHSRAFLARSVRFLAEERGVRQFLDIGTGMPTQDNTHQVAQRAAPESRIVYVDHDPLVLVHARALLTSSPEGACAYIDADVRNPEKIVRDAAVTLDFTRPIALMMLGILNHIPDEDDPYGIVQQLLEPLPSGSYLVLNDATDVINPGPRKEAIRQWNEHNSVPLVARTPEQISRFFDGMEVVPPGVVSVSRWRPEPHPSGEPAEVDAFCGIGKKP